MRTRILAALALVLGAVVAVTATETAEAADPTIWRQDRFLIGGWVVNDAAIEPQRLVTMNDAGLDYVHNFDNGGELWRIRRLVVALDSLRRARPGFGLQAMLHYSQPPTALGRFTGNLNAAAEWDAIRSGLQPEGGMNGGSVLGWCLWDEPCSPRELEPIIALTRRLRSDPSTAGRLPYINLMPIAREGRGSCIDDAFKPGRDRLSAYRAYLDAYLAPFDGDSAPAPPLSFDHYPFQRPDEPVDAWFENLRVAAEAARDHSRPGRTVPLWVVIQLSPYKEKGKPWPATPTFAQTRWQAWTALAYGAKSISYFTIGPVFNPRNDRGWGPGIMEYSGAKTTRFEPLKSLDAELHAVGGPLFAATWKGAWRSDQGTVPDANDWGLRDVTSDAKAPAVVGAYAVPNGAQHYLLAVNMDLDRSATIRVRLRGTADLVERIDRQTGKSGVLARGVTEFKLAGVPAATAELIRVTPRP